MKQKVIKDFGDTVLIRAGEIYKAGNLQRFWLGDHYRDIWLTAVKVPKLDFDSVLGGLTILGKGGGEQTLSLKVLAANGQPYNLRSLQKDPSASLPENLRSSFADDVVQDQISASNPYAPFVLPELGDSAGIFHTNPKLFYIPDTPELGEYREEFAGVLVMLEEDADENWENYEDFGYTTNAVGTDKVLEELEDDNDNQVDQKNFLKVRLFDMWIGDWDRHEGQYRWAELAKEKGNLYKAIPEDRDNMFFRFDGVLPWIASRKWALRKFKDFYKIKVKDIGGLNWQARHIDRRFLTELEKQDWIEAAKELQQSLTDELIASSLKKLPDAVYRMYADTLNVILQQRRALLEDYALRYYAILAEEVNVVGSDEHELFVVDRLADGATKVNLYKSNDDGEKKKLIYERLFKPDETEEIRLFGLEKEDYFVVRGQSKKGIEVRIIGGEGEDHLNDSSRVKGWGDKTLYYDLLDEDNEVVQLSETKVILRRSLDVNRYDFDAFEYDYFGPSLYMGYNKDYGVFVGGGVLIRKQAFHKFPYSSEHRIVANISPSTKAWNFLYEGDFVDLFGKAGLNVKANLQAPNYFSNFYGFGNENPIEESESSSDYYHVDYNKFQFDPNIKFRVGENSFIEFGPSYRMINVAEKTNRFYSDIQDSLPFKNLQQSHYLGMVFEAGIMSIKDRHFPQKGIRWNISTALYDNLNNELPRFAKLQTDFSAYYTFHWPLRTTIAARVGGASNVGEFAFYDGNSIGGNEGLGRPGTVRGFHRDRFMGRSSIYQNTEIRIKLLDVPFYYLPFAFGISGHHDIGRVWADDQDSDKWHSGIGGGLWFGPLERWVFTLTYTGSEEGDFYNGMLGFLF